MTLVQFITWILVVDGVTTIVTTSLLFRPLREAAFFVRDGHRTWLGKLIHCPMCFGFWVGVLGCLLGIRILEHRWLVVALVANGSAASTVCWTTHLIRSKLNETLGL